MPYARLVLAVLLLALGCASKNRHSDLMDLSPQTVGELRPEPGRALVVFAPHQGQVSAVLYDGDTLVGVSAWNTAVAYQAVPGSHRFMVVTEAADFMDAELVAGKVYYVRFRLRMGVWRARFSLAPIDARQDAVAIAELKTAAVATLTDRAREWDQRNRDSVREKRAAYEAAWLAKPEAERPLLRAGDAAP